jgi:hypothetical protein
LLLLIPLVARVIQMMLLLIVVVALPAVLVGDDDGVDEKVWKLMSCETQNLTHSLSCTCNPTIYIIVYRKQTIDCWKLIFS